MHTKKPALPKKNHFGSPAVSALQRPKAFRLPPHGGVGLVGLSLYSVSEQIISINKVDFNTIRMVVAIVKKLVVLGCQYFEGDQFKRSHRLFMFEYTSSHHDIVRTFFDSGLRSGRSVLVIGGRP